MISLRRSFVAALALGGLLIAEAHAAPPSKPLSQPSQAAKPARPAAAAPAAASAPHPGPLPPTADIEFVQIGPPCDDIEPFKDKVSVRTLPVMSRIQAVEQMRSASLLYLKQGPPRYGRSANSVAAKTYEYLASGVPILADVPPGGDADLIREHGRNSWLITSGSRQELKDAILAAYARRLSIEPGVDPKYVKQYSRATLTKRLAALLDESILTPASDCTEELQKQYEFD